MPFGTIIIGAWKTALYCLWYNAFDTAAPGPWALVSSHYKAYIVMAYIVVACIAMAYIATTYIVMAMGLGRQSLQASASDGRHVSFDLPAQASKNRTGSRAPSRTSE